MTEIAYFYYLFVIFSKVHDLKMCVTLAMYFSVSGTTLYSKCTSDIFNSR